MIDSLRYPIGKVAFVEYSEKAKNDCVAAILAMPPMLDFAIEI